MSPYGISDLFSGYESDFQQSMDDVSNVVNSIDIKESGYLPQLQSCHQQLKEAEQCLTQMELEARSLPSDPELSDKLRCYRREFDQLQRSLRSKLTEMQRSSLGDGRKKPSRADNDKLSRLERQFLDGSNKLREAQMNALEAEDHGLTAIRDLESQTEQLEGMRGNMKRVGDHLEYARQTIQVMLQRAMHQKRLVHILGFLLIVAFILLLYIRFKPAKSSVAQMTPSPIINDSESLSADNAEADGLGWS